MGRLPRTLFTYIYHGDLSVYSYSARRCTSCRHHCMALTEPRLRYRKPFEGQAACASTSARSSRSCAWRGYSSRARFGLACRAASEEEGLGGCAGRSAAVRRRGELRAANPESAGPRAQARARARPVATAGAAADNGRRKCHPRCKQLCQPDPCLSTHTHTHPLVGVRVAPKLTLSRIV